MSNKDDQTPPKKSIPNLKALLLAEDVVPIPPSPKGPKARDINRQIVMAMMGDNGFWPEFPARLHKISDTVGEPICYAETQGIVRRLANAGLDDLIVRYWHDVLTSGPCPIVLGAIQSRDVREIRILWYCTAVARENNFPMIVWKSDPRPAFHRLPFDPIPVEGLDLAHPLFNDLMQRTSNAEGLKAFIGSLLDDRSQRQQYVWMYGEGGNGKGALMRVLAATIGRVMSSEQVPTEGERRFWTSGLVGKRLAYFPDCNNSTFVTSGLFKSLTGEDQVRTEFKGGAILSLTLPLKFIFVSNKRPAITSQKSDQRRIIYCHIGAVNKEDNNYEERLLAEAPAIMSACWWAYVESTKGNPRALLPTPEPKDLAELAARTEDDYEGFVDQYIGWNIPTGKTPPNHMRSFVPSAMMKDTLIQAGFRSQYERRQVKDYLEQKHQMVETVVEFPATISEPARCRRGYLDIKIFKRF